MSISKQVWRGVFAVLLLSSWACGSSSSAPAPAPSEPATPAPAPAAEPAAPTPAAKPSAAISDVVNDPAFTLRLIEAGPYKAGELGRFVLQLEPHGVFHINQEYPFEASFTAGANTTLAKAKLERPDAAEFDEKKVRFEVPFTPKTAGEQKISANVKFAVCTEENCVPDERNLSLALAVK